jgi:hypothetical protein
LTDAEAQQKRQKPTPAPVSDPTPVDQPSEQTAPAQDTSSAIIPQGPTTDVVIEDIPSASSADPSHDPLQAAPSSQAQEIALKQVNQSITWFIISSNIINRISNSFYLIGTRLSR